MTARPASPERAETDVLFCGSLAFSLVVAGFAAWPVNRWLIGRGRSHAVIHTYHQH